MSWPSSRPRYAYPDYVLLESVATTRHEYLDGEIYAMAGGTPRHASLASTVLAILDGSLPAGCHTFTSDLRIRVEATSLATYPDASIVCGPVVTAPDDPHAATNPLLVVEVTSDSSETYDRGEKLGHYQKLPSLQAVLIVSHRERRLTLHTRTPAGWVSEDAVSGQSLKVEALSLEVHVDPLYDRALPA